MGDGGYLLRRLNVKAVPYEDKRIQNPYGLNRRWHSAYYKNEKTLRRKLLKNLLIGFYFILSWCVPLSISTSTFCFFLFRFSVGLSSMKAKSKHWRISLYAHQFPKPVKHTPAAPLNLKSQISTKTMDSRPVM